MLEESTFLILHARRLSHGCDIVTAEVEFNSLVLIHYSSPSTYRFEVYELDGHKPLGKSYFDYLLKEFDIKAQHHRGSDPAGGDRIVLDYDGIQLDIIQEGDRNLMWHNVQNAIKLLQAWYNDPLRVFPAKWTEVVILETRFLQGTVKMAARPGCTA